MDDDTLLPNNNASDQDPIDPGNNEQESDQESSSSRSLKDTYNQGRNAYRLAKNQGENFKPPIDTPTPATAGGSITSGGGVAGNSAAAGSAGAAASGASASAGAAGAAGSSMAATGSATAGGGIIAFFSTPPGWVTLGIIIILLLLIFIILEFNKPDDQNVTVTLAKSGPEAVKNPISPSDDPANELEYTLNVSYTGNPSSINVTDYLPEGVEYVEGSASNDGTYNSSSHTVTWNLSGGGGTTGGSGSSSLNTFNQSYFSGLGFPTPQDGVVKLSADGLKRWDEGAGAAVLKAAGIVGIDPGIVGAWSFFEGINYDMKVDNCQDSEYDLNTPCASNNWQVGGPGVRPGEQVGILAEAFEKMYGSSDASTVQKVGQDVYSKIGRSATFPSKSAATLASDFRNGGAARDQVGDLMRDYSIGAYVLATIFKEMGNGVADTMEGWSTTYYNRQDYINTIKALYDAR